MSIGPNTSDGSVNRVSRYSKYSVSGIRSASLNLITRSLLAVPGAPTRSSGSWATAATHMRSISGCLATKNRPSAVRNRLIRSRSVEASRASSSNDSAVARSIGSGARSIGSASRPEGTALSAVTEYSQVAVQAAADQLLVVLDESPADLAEREVVGGDPEHERLDEVEHREAVVAVGSQAVGDVVQPVGEPADPGQRVAERRLRVGQRERAGQLEPRG